ncbi:MAG TPA: hypothetical protein VFQ61_32835 [Polyangiaceae bacterium]|nr:hypothetical protein [Polyangiaceae bacterium]
MSAASTASKTRYRYPIHAVILVVAAWLFLLALLAGYATVAIALFPMSPIVAIGAACLIGSVHSYAVSVRETVRD